jgi:hypothetical protein
MGEEADGAHVPCRNVSGMRRIVILVSRFSPRLNSMN